MDWADKAEDELNEELELGLISKEQFKNKMRMLREEVREDSFYPDNY